MHLVVASWHQIAVGNGGRYSVCDSDQIKEDNITRHLASDSLSHGSVWSPSFSLMRLVTHATGSMGRILAEH